MRRRSIAGWMALALLVAIGGSAWYRWQAPGLAIVDLEVAGSADRALAVVDDDAEAFRREIGADWVFIASYLTALLVLARVVLRACPWRWLRRGALPLGAAAILAALLDVVENVLLLRGLDQLPDGGTSFAVARAAAIGKFALVGVAAVLLVVGAVAALVRPAPVEPEPAGGV